MMIKPKTERELNDMTRSELIGYVRYLERHYNAAVHLKNIYARENR